MIVDTSAVVPWLIDTPFSPAARKLKPVPTRAPALILVEATNALLKYLRAGRLTMIDVSVGIDSLRAALDEVVDDRHLLQSAMHIAAANHHKIYDCLYLALAFERSEPFASADRRLYALANTLGIETLFIEPSAA